MHTAQKGFIGIIVILILIFLVLVGIGYFLYINKGNSSAAQDLLKNSPPTQDKEYINTNPTTQAPTLPSSTNTPTSSSTIEIQRTSPAKTSSQPTASPTSKPSPTSNSTNDPKNSPIYYPK